MGQISGLVYTRRFAEFATGSRFDFANEKIGKSVASRVAEPYPGEVKKFVEKNQAKENRLLEQGCFEDKPALANKSGRINSVPRPGAAGKKLAMPGNQARLETQKDVFTQKLRQPLDLSGQSRSCSRRKARA